MWRNNLFSQRKSCEGGVGGDRETVGGANGQNLKNGVGNRGVRTPLPTMLLNIKFVL